MGISISIISIMSMLVLSVLLLLLSIIITIIISINIIRILPGLHRGPAHAPGARPVLPPAGDAIILWYYHTIIL